MFGFILAVYAVFGMGYVMQEKYDLCEEVKFKSERCELQKKMSAYKKCVKDCKK